MWLIVLLSFFFLFVYTLFFSHQYFECHQTDAWWVEEGRQTPLLLGNAMHQYIKCTVGIGTDRATLNSVWVIICSLTLPTAPSFYSLSRHPVLGLCSWCLIMVRSIKLNKNYTINESERKLKLSQHCRFHFSCNQPWDYAFMSSITEIYSFIELF